MPSLFLAGLFIFVYNTFVQSQLYSKRPVHCSGHPTKNETKPWWLLDAPYQDTRTGELPQSVDITIIGSGIAGSSILYFLTQYLNEPDIVTMSNAKTSILLLDARGAAGGASGRNAGSVHVSEDRAFSKTFDKYDEQTAVKQYKFTLENVNDIINFIETYDVNSNVELGVFLNTFTNAADKNVRKNAIELMQRYGVGLDETILNADDTISQSHGGFGGVIGPFSYTLDPAQIVFKLIELSIMNTNNVLHADGTNKVDLNIQYQTMVDAVQYDAVKELYTVHTKNRGVVNTKIIVFATNAYTSYLLPQFCKYIFPVKGQCIVSKPLNDLLWQHQNISGIKAYIDRGLVYYTQFATNNRILILVTPTDGRWSGDYNDSQIDLAMTKYMKEYLSNRYDIIAQQNGIEIEVEWQGIIGATIDGHPFIGPIVNMSNAYISAGYHGLGLTEAFNAGKIIASMITNKTINKGHFNDVYLPSARMQSSCDV